MNPTIEQRIATFGLPTGFKRLLWKDAVVGQQVWLWGTFRDGTDYTCPKAYGPHTVVSIEGTPGMCGEGGYRVLKNSRGEPHLCYLEELLVKETA